VELAFLPDGRRCSSPKPAHSRHPCDMLNRARVTGAGRHFQRRTNDGLKWVALLAKLPTTSSCTSRSGEREHGTTLAIGRGKSTAKPVRDVKQIFVADAWEASGNGRQDAVRP